MDKAREIEILRLTAQSLGTDSYCGPWLVEELPNIQADMANDLPVFVSMADSRRRANEMIEQARYTAEQIIEHAKTNAETITSTAKRRAEEISAHILTTLGKVRELAVRL